MNKSLHIILFLLLALSGHADITHAYDCTDRLVRYSAGTAYVRQSGRGYTGHEHLTAFGLVNMNARLYDPLTARFLSPDNLVQAPALGQNYNRYSYCLNNPLKYVDKDGNLWWLLFAITDTFSNILKHGLNISQYKYKKTIYSCQRI